MPVLVAGEPHIAKGENVLHNFALLRTRVWIKNNSWFIHDPFFHICAALSTFKYRQPNGTTIRDKCLRNHGQPDVATIRGENWPGERQLCI
jgi:hypothetical protein